MCASDRFEASGKFRVNAHHKILDAWLLVLCTECGDTVKLRILERANVRTISPTLLNRWHDNDPRLVTEMLQDPMVQRRNRFTLDWDGTWHLDTGGSDLSDLSVREVVDVHVHFAARIPVRPVRLIAEGCGLSRGEVERLIVEGKLVSAVRLDGKLSSDFTFTLKR